MDDSLQVDHLVPDRKEGKEFWKRPAVEDIQNVSVQQVVPVTIDGDWIQLPMNRSVLYQVKNYKKVEDKFSPTLCKMTDIKLLQNMLIPIYTYYLDGYVIEHTLNELIFPVLVIIVYEWTYI